MGENVSVFLGVIGVGCIGLGTAPGVVLGVAPGNIALGTVPGIVLGVAPGDIVFC